MNVMIFGATGMLGQGVLRACLLAPDVGRVLAVGRTTPDRVDGRIGGLDTAKLRALVHADLFELGPVEHELAGFDACFFCLGVSAAGMTEAAYSHLTHDLTLSVAARLARLNPAMTFVYVSGAGTDATERGRTMWARVKGRTENDLLRLPFKAAHMLRPGVIQPLHGARSKTGSYRLLYTLASPLLPALRRFFPRSVLTTEVVARAMLALARGSAAAPVLETADIDRLGSGADPAR